MDAELSRLLSRAAEILRRGGVIIHPTETVYGLAAVAEFPEALARIRAIKGREEEKPLLVLTDIWERAMPWIARVRPEERLLMEEELPLTILFDPSPLVPPVLRGTSPYIGIRRTTSPLVRRLIDETGYLLASTSANVAGEKPPTRVAEITPEIRQHVDFIVDHDEVAWGVPSTVVRIGENGQLQIIRPGAVSQEQLMALLEE